MPLSAGQITITPAAAWPTMTHQVAFSSDPNDPTQPTVWADITGRVRGWSVRRGRQSYELGTVDAGEHQLDLINDTGVFDPTNSAGPYWPNVLPGRRVRCAATWQGVTYPLFLGYMERWPQSWTHRGLFGAGTPIAHDAFSVLASTVIRSVYEQEVLADAPILFLPMTETVGPTVGNIAETAGPNLAAQYTVGTLGAGAVQFGGAELLTGGGSGIAVTGATPTDGAVILGLPWFLIGQFALEVWLVADPAASGRIWLQTTRQGVATALLQLNSDGTISATLADRTGATTTATSRGTIRDGKPHQVAAVWDATGGTVTVYIDGQPDGTGSLPLGPAITDTTSSHALADLRYVGSPQITLRPVTVGFMSFYASTSGTALSAARILVHYQAGSAAAAGDTTDARFLRVAGYAALNVPVAAQPSQTRLIIGDQINQGNALQQLQDTAAWEGGVAFVAADGTLTFRARTDRYAKTTPRFTFGENADAGELPYQDDVAFDFDDTYISNVIRDQQRNGPLITASDAVSLGRYFRRTLDETVDIADPLEVEARADWLLGRYKDPHLRIPSLTLEPSTNPALWPAVLSLEIGDRVRVNRRPAAGAPAISMDGFVEAIDHQVPGPFQWRTTLQVSPVGPQVWILEDLVYGSIDGPGVIAY